MLGLVTMLTATFALYAPGALGAAGEQVVVSDGGGDGASAATDLQRVSMQRMSDGSLRAALTLRGAFVPADLLAKSGPPGGLCLRLWTTPGIKPSANPPDYLVCVTATADGANLQASILKERPNDLPTRIARAAVSQSSTHSVILTFPESIIGRPSSLRFGAEVTRAGCVRISCTDTAPDAPHTARLVLTP